MADFATGARSESDGDADAARKVVRRPQTARAGATHLFNLVVAERNDHVAGVEAQSDVSFQIDFKHAANIERRRDDAFAVERRAADGAMEVGGKTGARFGEYADVFIARASL